ncbi:MAG: hypothetical protein Q4D98_01390 [Planctomycetia bacterium]|nr:hypothetical protein [Planctomycetia bacterium]
MNGKRFVALLVCVCGMTAWGQDSSLPPMSYFAEKTLFYDGKFDDALKEFQSEWRGSFKIGTHRWIDAICFATMQGECYYQMGRYPEALDQYTSALQLYMQYFDWMTKISNIPAPGNNNINSLPPWGDAKRGRRLNKMPEKVSLLFGDPDYQTKTYQSGDTVNVPVLRSIRAEEIVRCTMIAIRRRGEILGPLAVGDELNAQLLNRLPGLWQTLSGSWLQAWIDIEAGLVQVASGKEMEGAQSLVRGALIGGADHPLTCYAYLALGDIALRAGDYDKSLQAFLEAATLAYYFEDAIAMEDAFRGLADAYYLKNPAQVCPALQVAEVWARKEKLTLLRGTVLPLLADDYLRKNQVKPAAECVAEAERTMNRRAMRLGRAGARLNYMRAKVAFRDPSPASQTAASQAITAAMEFMLHGSLRNFQLNLVDQRLLSGNLTPRKAMEFYETLLKDPTGTEWALKPMESMSLLLTPRPGTWENWFLSAMEMEKIEQAFEISERARRASFLQTLHFGGRIHALRLLLEMPERDLSVVQLQRRRDLLTESPDYDVRAKKIRTLQTQIRTMALPAKTDEDAQTLNDRLRQIEELSHQQEAYLATVVLERRPIDLLFPPVKTFKEIQDGLPDGEAMLVFFAARNQMYLFLLNNQQFTHWVIRDRGTGKGSARRETGNDLTQLQTHLASMLRKMGLLGGSTPFRETCLDDRSWKQDALQVMADLTKNSQADFSRSDFSSLVIVPDRFAWYLPFEMLQVQTPKGLRPTIFQFAIRYAPTASLGVPWKKPTLAVSPYTLLVCGKEEPTEARRKSLYAAVKRPVEFDAKSFGGAMTSATHATSSIFAPAFDQMFVFDDQKNDPALPFSLTPVVLDANRKGATLGNWFAFPYGGPRLVYLSGFHTQTENLAQVSSKKKNVLTAPAGMELFLTSLSFMANGCDTLVLSRWHMGGDSSYRMAEEFLGQMQKTDDVSRAWRKAVLKQAAAKMDLSLEPRIAAKEKTTAKGTFPAFWATYMLIDSGQKMSLEEPDADDDVPAIVVP